LETTTENREHKIELKEIETPDIFPFIAAPTAPLIEVKAALSEKIDAFMYIDTFPGAGILFLDTSTPNRKELYGKQRKRGSGRSTANERRTTCQATRTKSTSAINSSRKVRCRKNGAHTGI
jgi:hypothetical protein